jgi:hypothetical protein
MGADHLVLKVMSVALFFFKLQKINYLVEWEIKEIEVKEM